MQEVLCLLELSKVMWKHLEQFLDAWSPTELSNSAGPNMPPGSRQNGSITYRRHPGVCPSGVRAHLPFPIGVGGGGEQT